MMTVLIMEKEKMAEIESAELIKNYLKSQSYQKEYIEFMNAMLDKYGVEVFNLNGIGEQLDFNKSIKNVASVHTFCY